MSQASELKAEDSELSIGEVPEPDITDLVIDDGAPVDNIYSEKQQRLLTSPLWDSWPGPPPEEEGARRSFVALANVGVFISTHLAPLVPDALLSIDVRIHPDMPHDKRHQSYFIWEFGRPPTVVVEVVSNQQGGELDRKRRGYARMGVPHYVVWDPDCVLGAERLHCFELRGDLYVPRAEPAFEALGLRLAPWTGEFEQYAAEWLRWHDLEGAPVPTGAERAEHEKQRAEHEKQRAEHEKQRAEHEKQRAEHEKQRAERLAARLRELGVEPEE
jgi:hypothetical protein